MSEEPPESLLAAADELYGLPLGDFTPRRDALAKALRGSDRALSEAIKALRKPTMPAWVLNVFVRGDPEQVAQVLDIGLALREAQRNLDGEELRALTRQRRQLTAAVTVAARKVAAGLGQRVTQAVADQVEGTLTAAMVDEAAEAGLRSGLLLAAIQPLGPGASEVTLAVGADLVEGFTPTRHEVGGGDGRPDLRVVPEPEESEEPEGPDERQLEAARTTLAEADDALTQALEEHEQAAQAVSDLEARALQVSSEIEELRRRLSESEEAAEEIEDELSDAEDERTAAAETLESARSAHDEAAAALARLEGGG